MANELNQDSNHVESKAGKALREGKGNAFVKKVVREWKKVYMNYHELSDFLADYFNMTESMSWAELQLYGDTIHKICHVRLEVTEKPGPLYLTELVPFNGWAYKWFDISLYDFIILEKEPTEDEIRRLAYRIGEDYDELKKKEAQGEYGEGKMWSSVKEQILELASYSAYYSFWD